MEKIRINVTIKASSQVMYKALSTEDGLSSWWAKQTTAKPEIGFLNTFTFGTFVNKMKVVELIPGEKVVWECVESIDEWVGTFISFELEDKGEKTLLRFTHSHWKEITDMFAGCTYDWARFMGSLKALCETGTGDPA
jgi:uncharacterized protein YndB with AHSA1/START domain